LASPSVLAVAPSTGGGDAVAVVVRVEVVHRAVEVGVAADLGAGAAVGGLDGAADGA